MLHRVAGLREVCADLGELRTELSEGAVEALRGAAEIAQRDLDVLVVREAGGEAFAVVERLRKRASRGQHGGEAVEGLREFSILAGEGLHVFERLAEGAAGSADFREMSAEFPKFGQRGWQVGAFRGDFGKVVGGGLQ